MEKALKQKWLEALRSGKYKQGRFALRTKIDDYCCLGVLCDVSGVSEWEENGLCYSYGGALSFLPFRLRDQLASGARAALVAMNDDYGMSFPDIADWIGTNIPEDDQ
jgi:hypothetical protein